MAVEKQGKVIYMGKPTTRAEEDQRTANANTSRLDELEKAVTKQADELTRLRKYAPPIAAKWAWRIRLGFEIAGVVIAAAGAWWVYPPAAPLLVGGWMLGDVLAMRHLKKKRSE